MTTTIMIISSLKVELLIAITDPEGKRGFAFLESETQKMINCKHSACEFTIFSSYILTNSILKKYNNDCRNYIHNVSEIFQEINMSKEKSLMQ